MPILQDPFISPKINPRNRIHFILQFDSKHNSAFKECSNAITKISKKQNDTSQTEHMTNNAIFLIETIWKRIKSKELLKTQMQDGIQGSNHKQESVQSIGWDNIG